MSKATWMLIAAVGMWGLTIAPTKWALETLPPITLCFLRLGLGSLLFLPLAWMRASRSGQPVRIPWRRIWALSFTGVGGYFALDFTGVALTSGVHASILGATMPLFTLLLAMFVLKERIRAQQWFGLALGVIGVLLISVQPEADEGSSLLGDVLVLLSCLVWAVYVVQLKQPGEEAALSRELFTALTLAIGAVMLLPLVAVELWFTGLPTFPPKTWGSMVYLVLGPTILSYLLWNKALERVSAASAGIYLNIQPLISVIASIVLLGESMSLRSFVGSVLILVGVFGSEYRRSGSKAASAEKLNT